MRKALFILSLSVATLAAHGAFAQNPLKKGIISRGFYIHGGVAFPAGKPEVVAGSSVSRGIRSENADRLRFGTQVNLEIGNQFYFFKVPTDKLGIGLRISWLQFGYSSYKDAFVDSTNQKVFTMENTLIDLKLLKFGPQVSVAIADNMALDFAVLLSPSVYVGRGQIKNEPGYNFQGGGGTAGAALLFEPSVRFRYRKLAAGLEYAFGRAALVKAEVAGSGSGTGTTGTVTLTAGAYRMGIPRIFVGFKF